MVDRDVALNRSILIWQVEEFVVSPTPSLLAFDFCRSDSLINRPAQSQAYSRDDYQRRGMEAV